MLDRHPMQIIKVTTVLVFFLLGACQWNIAKALGQNLQGRFSEYLAVSLEERGKAAEELGALLNSNNLPAIQDFADELITIPLEDLTPTERFSREQYLLELAINHPRLLRRHSHLIEEMLSLESEQQKLFGLTLISLVGSKSTTLMSELSRMCKHSGNSPSLHCQYLATAWCISNRTEYREALLSIGRSSNAEVKAAFCRTVGRNQLISFSDEIKVLSKDGDSRVRVAAISVLLSWSQCPQKKRQGSSYRAFKECQLD